MSVKRDDVIAALRVEDVINHYGIKLHWSGRWGRSRRCPVTDHSSDAFGISRTGMWHDFACDRGGDLLGLVAFGEGIDVRSDFPRVLEVAAQIAGIDTDPDDFGGIIKAPPKERPPIPDAEPIAVRLERARKRAAWVWERMGCQITGQRTVADMYLGTERRLPMDVLRTREDVRTTPIRITPDQIGKSEELRRLARMFSVPGVAIPVRSPIDGALVDIRIRRVEPTADQPKIVGMLGGVTASAAGDQNGRELLGCYGFPHELKADMIVVVEGALDYLTALCAWPSADVLGAVEAGSLSLVAKLAAQSLAARDDKSLLLIIEQNDGTMKAGDKAVNEDLNAATKVAVRVLGPRRVGWMFCEGKARDGRALTDLNDLWRASVPIKPVWWSEMGEAVA